MLSRINEFALGDNQKVSLFARTKWLSVAAWGGLALVGQAASLQMIDAGRLIHFQHYRLVSELLNHKTIALVLFGFQVICVGVGVWQRRIAIGQWLQSFNRWQLALAALFLIFASAAVTPDTSVYLTSLAIGSLVQLTNIANVILFIWAIPASTLESVRKYVDRFLTGDSDSRSDGVRLDKLAWIAAICMFVLTASLSYFVYQAHPHVPDESQYIFQANYMAASQLTVKPPLVPEAFSMYMVPTQEARWFGIFPPAWPALLALGTLIGTSWLVNPLLAGLTILAAYLLFQQFYSKRFARIATVLLCSSPWFIFMGMSYMSHMATLFFSLAAALLLMRGVKEKSIVFLLIAGVAVGVIGLIRPLDAAIVGLLLAIWAFYNSETWKARISATAILATGTVGVALLNLPYNASVTGSYSLSPSDAYYNKYFWPKVMSLGFGPERGMHWGLDAFAGHSPIEALVNAALNIFLLNTELFGWGAGSLLLVTLLAISGSISKKDIWAVMVIVAVVGAYSLFWYHGGPDFGARYWFLCIIPLVALTVRGAEWLANNLSKGGGDPGRCDLRVSLALAMICVLSLVVFIPWRISDKYYHYLGMQPGIEQLAKDRDFGRSLVIVRGSEHPDYQSAWVYNPVNFDGLAPIYAFDKNVEVYTELLRKYSDRPVWIVNGPSLTGADYAIVRGPVDPSELLRELTQ